MADSHNMDGFDLSPSNGRNVAVFGWNQIFVAFDINPDGHDQYMDV